MNPIDFFSSEISAIYSQSSDHKTQSDRLQQLLQNAFNGSALQSSPQVLEFSNLIKRLVEIVVNNESTSMVVSRQFITDITVHLKKPNTAPELVKLISHSLLDMLQARAIAYEEQTTQIRLLLADLYEKEKLFQEAAHILVGIPLETGQRNYSSEFKMETYLRVAELCLEAQNVDEAETQVNRASLLQNSLKDNSPLIIRYKVVYARVLDRRGRFVEAAQRYHELSFRQGLLPSEKIAALQNSLTCTILAPPGGQRNRLLTTLFKDERCHQLAGYLLLKNMYLERLIKTTEITEFELVLLPHQKILDVDGASILQRSVIEQNVLAASKLYSNISFESLGQLLEIPASKVERIVMRLISSDRLKGDIDQLEGFVSFEEQNALSKWDSSITSLCDLLNEINESIAANHPEWHAEKFNQYSIVVSSISDNIQSSSNGKATESQSIAIEMGS